MFPTFTSAPNLLRSALRVFDQHGVDQLVVLGDLAQWGENLIESAILCAEAHAAGVWGNHDFQLCKRAAERDPETLEKYPEPVVELLASLRPRLEIGGCLFTHVEPWLDMEDERHLWYIDGIPDSMDKIRRSFRAVPDQFMFVGHFHRWQIADNFEILDWSGQEPIVLNKDRRYLIVCGAVCLGQCGIFDTDSRELIPINVETGAVRV